MHCLYEKFNYGYYHKEYPNYKISASQIDWDLDDEFEELLPVMQANIVLECNEKVLIICKVL